MDVLNTLQNPLVELVALSAVSGLTWLARRRVARLRGGQASAFSFRSLLAGIDRFIDVHVCGFDGKPHPAWGLVQDDRPEAIPLAVRAVTTVTEAASAQTPAPAPCPAAPVVRPAVAAGDGEWLAERLTKRSGKANRIKLSEIAQADNIAIIGQKGSGKTTLLLTIMRHRQSDYLALDPHSFPGKWPCRTVGAGRDYEAIRAALLALDTGMNKRFGQLASGEVAEECFARRTVVADEFRSIADNLPNSKGEKGAGKYILDRISEGRKVGECVLLAGHNDTVTDLGIEGSSSMKTCFDFIIYTAGIAVQRYFARDKGNAEPAMVAELEREERKYIVWKTNTNEWFIMDFDLAPVVVGSQVMSSVSPDHTTIPVRREEPEIASLGSHTTHTSMPSMVGIQHQEAIPTHTAISGHTGDELLLEALKDLQQRAGWSENKLIELTGVVGEKAKRQERVRALVALAEARKTNSA